MPPEGYGSVQRPCAHVNLFDEYREKVKSTGPESKTSEEAWTTTLGRCLVTSKENTVCESMRLAVTLLVQPLWVEPCQFVAVFLLLCRL